MQKPRSGRRRALRSRVYYFEGPNLRPADLIFDGGQPILVVKWRTLGARREPALFCRLDRAQLWPVAQRKREFVYRGPLVLKGRD